MSEQIRCGACGAGNNADASWCNQCFASLGVPEPPVEAPSVPVPTFPQPDVTPQPTSVVEVEDPEEDVSAADPSEVDETEPGEDGPSWSCQVCHEQNPLTTNVCSVCQTPIFVSFGAVQEEELALSPSEAVAQAFVPGLAHIRLGHGLIGFTIALLVWVLIAFALIIAFAGGATVPVLFVFMLAIAIILVSVHDAQRLAQRQVDSIILKPRILTFVALAAIGLVIAIIWVQGLAGASNT